MLGLVTHRPDCHFSVAPSDSRGLIATVVPVVSAARGAVAAVMVAAIVIAAVTAVTTVAGVIAIVVAGAASAVMIAVVSAAPRQGSGRDHQRRRYSGKGDE